MPEVTQGNGNLEFKFQNKSVPTLLGALLSALFFFLLNKLYFPSLTS